MELSASFGNYTFLRSFRVLRPLRAITKIEALKVIMGTTLMTCWVRDPSMSVTVFEHYIINNCMFSSLF